MCRGGDGGVVSGGVERIPFFKFWKKKGSTSWGKGVLTKKLKSVGRRSMGKREDTVESFRIKFVAHNQGEKPGTSRVLGAEAPMGG